jgi:histidyl-tRNA synthetase
MAEKPSIPKGTRDFTPVEMARRDHIFDTVRRIFLSYGYLPIETPAMENLTTLLGKYGEEGDKLLFKILNSGDFRGDLTGQELGGIPSARLATLISEKGLRYDLTVPFARFVVQHRNEIEFPFKRFQIQPVWRADRPQRGRYREFYQCDVDVIGSDSLLNEYELVRIMDDVFRDLGLKVVIRMNNRKVLAGIAEVIGVAERMNEMTVVIDKLEKVGQEKVLRELEEKGVGRQALEMLRPLLHLEGKAGERISYLENWLSRSVIGTRGLEEVKQLYSYLELSPLEAATEFDLTLARGLNYYTGTIFEVTSSEVEIGSICGGGRYDDLTGIFGMAGISGVGVSFGADRIYDVLLQLDRFPPHGGRATLVLFVNFGEREVHYILPVLDSLRAGGVPAELFPDQARMKKQMGYAHARKIPFVALVGEQEMAEGLITLKEMKSGQQERLTPGQLLEKLRPLKTER